ncbi:MAG: GNAT family N-acetyltransferase [Acidobacteriia bacterium]|nr:GNAT family N-acetyltransferase [Terriglobia bacterium]
MIGTQIITLAPARSMKSAYNGIWKRLLGEAGSALRFGNIASSLTRIGPLDWLWIRRGFEIHKFVLIRGESESIGVGVIERDLSNRVCAIVLGLLPEYRGCRLGPVSARILLRKCFTEFDAARVESSALTSNPASIHMQDGMVHEGTLRDRFLIDGQRVDEMLFRLLRSEWESGVLDRESIKPASRSQAGRSHAAISPGESSST